MAGLFYIEVDVSEGAAPLTVNFTHPTNCGPNYTWDFGDNETSHEQNPTHTFQNPGIYRVTLQTWEQIEDTVYQNEFFETTITVTEPNPVVITIGIISPDTTAYISQPLPSGSRMTARKRK